MSKLIDSCSVLNKIINRRSKLNTRWLQDICMSRGLTEALEIILSEPIIDTMCTWISIKDKIPEPNKKYLTYAETTKYCNHPEIYDDGRINVLYYDGEEWYDEECISYNVTHWMPLPEKPESSRKGDGR